MTRPRITNSLKGALGETYYKELCNQKGWAYCSLENLYGRNLDAVWFKMGFNRLQVHIPNGIRTEVQQVSKPSNNSASNPSFVFDYLACKIDRPASKIHYPKDFCWSEIKTGLGLFSENQYKMMQTIHLPIAVFHIEDVLTRPQYVEMDWEMMTGKEFARTLEHTDDYRNDDYGRESRSDTRKTIIARFDGKCKTCKRKIVAGRDKLTQNGSSDWVHERCAA